MDLADKSNDVVGAGFGLAGIGVNHLDSAAAKATAAAETVEEVLQGDEAIKTVEGVVGVFGKIGIASAVIDAGIAIKQAWDNPTAGNVTKAVLKTTLAGLEAWGKVNPVAGVVIGILDLTGTTDALFEW